MKFRRGFLALFAVPVLAIGLAACGGSSNSSGSSSNAASTAPAQTSAGSGTISTKSVSGVGTVLVDSHGHALYTNNQDTSSKMACTSACQAFWPPLKASGGQPASSDSAIQAKLGVANGQVTFGGKPLYTFVQDTSPGQATGNGFMDSFDGTAFTWTAATASGTASSSGSTSAAPPATTSSSSSSSGGSSGGYGY